MCCTKLINVLLIRKNWLCFQLSMGGERAALTQFILLKFNWNLGAKCAASLDRCIMYIGENAAECVKTGAFVNLTKDGLIKLISSDYVSSLFYIHSYHTCQNHNKCYFTVLPGRGGCLAMCSGLGEATGWCDAAHRALERRGKGSRMSVLGRCYGTRSIIAYW